MKNRNLYIALITASFLATSAVSCKKDLLKTNPNNVTKDDYYKTAAELQLGTNAIYSVIRGNSLTTREWFFLHDLRSDEARSGGGQLEAFRAALLNGPADATNSVVGSVFNACYVMIHRANVIITKGPKVTDNPALVKRLIAEAKFFRAWAYFELVSQWGGVPIQLTPVEDPTDYKPRSTEAQVYAQIIADADAAYADLPNKSEYATADRGRVTKAAALMIKARALMQSGDYAGAKAALLLIPTSGANGYSLMPRYLDNFEEEAEYNNESIFEVSNAERNGDNTYNYPGFGDGNVASTTSRSQEYNTTAWRNLIPSDKYLNEFERVAGAITSTKDDPRFTYSFYKTGDLFFNGTKTLTDQMQNGNISNITGIGPIKTGFRKYITLYKKDINPNYTASGVNTRIYRYAEVLLNLAECENELGNQGQAVIYLNQVRARADVNMPGYPTAQFPVGTKDQVTRALMHEKMVEMGNEQVRSVDIIRWRKKGYYPTVAPEPIVYINGAVFNPGRDPLLPFPTSELDNNPLLNKTNNPGY